MVFLLQIFFISTKEKVLILHFLHLSLLFNGVATTSQLNSQKDLPNFLMSCIFNVFVFLLTNNNIRHHHNVVLISNHGSTPACRVLRNFWVHFIIRSTIPIKLSFTLSFTVDQLITCLSLSFYLQAAVKHSCSVHKFQTTANPLCFLGLFSFNLQHMPLLHRIPYPAV